MRKLYPGNPWLEPVKAFLAEVACNQGELYPVTVIGLTIRPVFYDPNTGEFWYVHA